METIALAQTSVEELCLGLPRHIDARKRPLHLAAQRLRRMTRTAGNHVPARRTGPHRLGQHIDTAKDAAAVQDQHVCLLAVASLFKMLMCKLLHIALPAECTQHVDGIGDIL